MLFYVFYVFWLFGLVPNNSSKVQQFFFVNNPYQSFHIGQPVILCCCVVPLRITNLISIGWMKAFEALPLEYRGLHWKSMNLMKEISAAAFIQLEEEKRRRPSWGNNNTHKQKRKRKDEGLLHSSGFPLLLLVKNRRHRHSSNRCLKESSSSFLACSLALQ